MDVVITGAGITGLAAAISLRRSGHRVTIYERSSLNNEVGAAINVPPNVTRFLEPWGLDTSRFVKAQGLQFQSYDTLENGPFQDHSRNAEIYGAPFYYAHRVDLHEGLKRLATDPEGTGVPVKIHLKSDIRKYDPEGPSITLADGTVVTADLVIAADGVHSVAVEAISGHKNPPQPAGHNNCCYRFLINTAELEADPETRFFVQPEVLSYLRLFPDPALNRRLVVYPCRNYEVINFVAICYKDEFTDSKEDWQCQVDKSEVLKTYEGYHPSLLAVVNKATEVKRWPLLYRSPISKWHKNRMAIAGDAAHPMLPHHGQGGAQGMEDGVAIGLVMHGVTDVSQIEARLALYEKIRRNRGSSIQVMSNTPFDGQPPAELAEFLEGQPLPTSMGEMIKLAYTADVIQRTVDTMKEFDPSWNLPEGYLPKQSTAQITENPEHERVPSPKWNEKTGVVITEEQVLVAPVDIE